MGRRLSNLGFTAYYDDYWQEMTSVTWSMDEKGYISSKSSIQAKEAPFQRDYYRRMYTAGDPWMKMYITMQFLGRYSVWNDLFPESFNGWTIKKDSSREMWMVQLFEFLREHKTLKLMYPCWEEFREVLQENWELE